MKYPASLEIVTYFFPKKFRSETVGKGTGSVVKAEPKLHKRSGILATIIGGGEVIASSPRRVRTADFEKRLSTYPDDDELLIWAVEPERVEKHKTSNRGHPVKSGTRKNFEKDVPSSSFFSFAEWEQISKGRFQR